MFSQNQISFAACCYLFMLKFSLFHTQKTGTNIKVYSECCPDSTERICAIAGKPEPVINCIETILELLDTVRIECLTKTCPCNIQIIAVKMEISI